MILNNLIFLPNILESFQPNILESIAITLYCISTLYKLIYNNTMSKVTPFLQEVVFIVADFLDSLEHTKEASKLRKQYEIPEWVKKDNPLIKKGLKKVLKQFINDNEKILKYYKNRKPDSDEQVQSEEEVQTPKPTKKARQSASPRQSPLVKPKSPKVAHHQPAPSKGWMASQFQQPKRLEDLNDDHHEVPKQAQVDVPKKDKKNHKKEVKKQSSSEEHSESQQTPKPKKQKKEIKKQKKVKRVKGPVDSSYLNSEEEFELEDKKAKRSVTPQKQSAEKTHKKVEPVKHQIVTRKKSTQIKEVPEKTSTQIAVKQVNKTWQNNDQNENNGPKKFFSRIDHNEVGFIPQNRRDNTFEAKARYGAGDSWGQFGHEKLKDTRGDSFKKTKGKLKNKAFQGSGINIDQVNSVPIL